MRRILVASKLTIDKHYARDMVGGVKYNSTHAQPGGAGVTVALVLRSLGFAVRLLGRYTCDDRPFRERAIDAGIEWGMRFVEGRTAVNAIIPDGPTILRVVPGPEYRVDEEDGRALADTKSVALALGGSLDADYATFLMEFAAARAIPCFWNPGVSADLQAMDCGAEVYLQVSLAEFSDGAQSPSHLARQLLGRTAAAGVVVTDASRGAYGIARGDAEVLYAPAIALGAPVREIGAGDAHFGGFIGMFLNAPKCVRFERSLELARLVAARHVGGHAPADWLELRAFANRYPGIAELQRAAA